jgi:hypothetical protein
VPMSLEGAMKVADSLLAELRRRSPEIERANAYYRGVHPLRFASSQFQKYYATRYYDFADNWCQVVGDAPVERLTTIGVKPYGEAEADVESWRVWQTNGLDADSQLGFLGAGNGGRSFVLVWNPDNSDTPTVTFEDATQAIVAYEPGSRRKRAAGLKWWSDGSLEYVTLFLPDEVWKFERRLYAALKNVNLVGAADELRKWTRREAGDEPNPQPNPMGEVPLVELPNRPLLTADPISDISGVIPMQDAVNMIWALLFNAADFASLQQRVILGAELPTTPILDSEGNIVGERPIPLENFTHDRVLWVPDEGASISSWPSADLKAYADILEVQVGHIAAQTRTPSHYLIGKISNLSSDALIAAETGLVKKCQEKQLWYGQGLREMFALIALAQNNPEKAKAISAGEVMWKDAETRNRAQLADSLVKLKTIGFPFEFLAGQYGLTPPEIATLMEMRTEEAAQDPISQALNRQTRPGPPGPGRGLIHAPRRRHRRGAQPLPVAGLAHPGGHGHRPAAVGPGGPGRHRRVVRAGLRQAPGRHRPGAAGSRGRRRRLRRRGPGRPGRHT